jgi:hypothetical protein
MKVLPVLDVSAFQVPQRFILAIAAQCAAEAENTEALRIATPFETEEGQALLAETAAHYWLEINELASETAENVVKAADVLAQQADVLHSEVEQFLDTVRAA